MAPHRFHPRKVVALLAAVTTMFALVACGSSSSGGSGGGGSVTMGEIFPFTGAKAELSGWGVHGVQAAMLDINKAGGIMGNKLKVVSTDDAADSVDALPALRKLLLSKPVAVIGPFSPTIEAVIHQFQPNDVADFALAAPRSWTA